MGIAFEEIEKKLDYIPSFKIKFSSHSPYSVGFGFSAALGASLISSILKASKIHFQQSKIFELTLKYEKFQHGNHSGADPAIIVYGELIKFKKNSKNLPQIKPLHIQNKDLKKYLDNSLVIHTGSANQSTGELVNFVKNKIKKNPKK